MIIPRSVFVVTWWGAERLVSDGLDIAQTAALGVGLGGGAAAIAAIATLTVGIHLGAIATALGLVGLYAWRSKAPTGQLAVSTLVPIVGFLWIIAYLFAAIPGTSMILIATAPLLAMGVIALGRKMEYPKVGLAIASIAALAAVGSSVGVAQIVGWKATICPSSMTAK